MKRRVEMVEIDGRPFILVDFEVPDDAPADVKEALSRRAVVMRGGVCACGGSAHWPTRGQRRAGITELVVIHRRDCIADDDNLRALLAEWKDN